MRSSRSQSRSSSAEKKRKGKLRRARGGVSSQPPNEQDDKTLLCPNEACGGFAIGLLHARARTGVFASILLPSNQPPRRHTLGHLAGDNGRDVPDVWVAGFLKPNEKTIFLRGRRCLDTTPGPRLSRNVLHNERKEALQLHLEYPCPMDTPLPNTNNNFVRTC